MSYNREIMEDLARLDRVNLGWITDENGQPLMYSVFVARLMKDMGSFTQDLLHAVVGSSGEAGELLDAVKKHWIYGRELDRKNVKEEMFDGLFYLQAQMILMDFGLQDLLTGSKDKLFVRYAGGNYSDAAAIARADKAATGETPKQVITDDTVFDGDSAYVENGKVSAINLTKEQVAAVDETAGLNPAAKKFLDSREETVGGFEPGDVVTATRAPETRMTVSHTGNPGRWYCHWFDGATACSGWFDEAELKLATPTPVVGQQPLTGGPTDSPQDPLHP